MAKRKTPTKKREALPPPHRRHDPEALVRMLHRHHPEAVPDPEATIVRLLTEQAAPDFREPVPRVDEDFEIEMERRARAAVEPARTNEEVFDDFVSGRGALATIGAVAYPDELQFAFKEEAIALRAELIRTHGSAPDTVMLCDTASTSFFEARHFAMLARTVLRGGLDDDHVKRALRLEEMSSRAHRRVLLALEGLRRPQGAAVRIQIGEAQNVAVGDQKVELAT